MRAAGATWKVIADAVNRAEVTAKRWRSTSDFQEGLKQAVTKRRDIIDRLTDRTIERVLADIESDDWYQPGTYNIARRIIERHWEIQDAQTLMDESAIVAGKACKVQEIREGARGGTDS